MAKHNSKRYLALLRNKVKKFNQGQNKVNIFKKAELNPFLRSRMSCGKLQQQNYIATILLKSAICEIYSLCA